MGEFDCAAHSQRQAERRLLVEPQRWYAPGDGITRIWIDLTLLDGDVVRKHLSSELNFSREHRDLNIQRIGYVASEITKNAGVAICAPIAPYTAMRRSVREMIEPHGAFIEIHVATPLETCEARDRKGLYAKARKGEIPEFTGISDPYEIPEHPELRVDTTGLTPMEAAQDIYLYLLREGYLDTANSGTE